MYCIHVKYLIYLKTIKQKITQAYKKSKTLPKESDSLYKEITEAAREPFLVLDKDLRVVEANAAFYRTFKVSKNVTEGKFLYELGNNQWDIPELRKLLKKILPKHFAFDDFEVEHIFKKTGSRTMLLNARPIKQRQLILLVIEDITEWKKIAENLTSTQLRLHSLFMQAPAFVAVVSGPKLIFEIANDQYRQLVGSKRKLDGLPLIEALPELEPSLLKTVKEVAFKGKRFVASEMQVILDWENNGKKTTKYITLVFEPLFDEAKKPNGLMFFGYEVTEQVLARQEKALRVKTFDTILSTVKDFIFTFDLEGRFTYSNRPLLELLGINLEYIIGKNFYELPYPAELATKLQTHISNVIKNGLPIKDETPFISPSGKQGYYEYIFAPIFDKNGNVELVTGSAWDITVRKEQEHRKDQFIGIVSHELRTPVTSIKAYTQLLELRFRKAQDLTSAEVVGKMDMQLNKLTNLIGDLLDVTKIDGGKLQFHSEYFDFNELVSEVAEEIQRTTEKHMISKNLKKTKMVLGDRERVGQVITNFLTNAIKYSPYAEKILVETNVEKGSIVFSVQDFGVGINPEDQSQVFDRFFRASEQDTFPGLGLGLYISAEIIHRLKGKISLESKKGKGSTFTFSLPI